MNKSLIINTLAFCFAISFAQAQNVTPQTLAGFWRISNTADSKPVSTFLRITPFRDNLFTGSYLSNGDEINLSGSIFDSKQIYAIEGADQDKNFTFDGSVQSDYTITGNYLESNMVTGQFVWEKVCDELGNAIDLNAPPCLEKTTTFKTETRMVKKLIQVADTTVRSGEMRDENIPLAEIFQDLPADAIITGHIGYDETVSYKTVEIEVPEQVVVTQETESQNTFSAPATTAAETSKGKVVVAEKPKPAKETPKKPTIKVNTETFSSSKIVSTSSAAAKPLPISFDVESKKIPSAAKKSSSKMAESFNVATQKPVKSYDVNASQSVTDAAKKAKLQSCDTPVADASIKLAQMVRGTTAEENGHIYHVVGAGETMTAVGKLYNISIVKLAELNNKDCERIFVGERLLVK